MNDHRGDNPLAAKQQDVINISGKIFRVINLNQAPGVGVDIDPLLYLSP